MKNQNCTVLIGRVLLGLLFVVTGTFTAQNIPGTTDMIASVGLPMAALLAYVVVLIKVGGGLALMAGWHTRYAAGALITFTALATAFFHLDFPGEMVNFLKNAAIIGGLLYAVRFGGGAWSLDART